MPTTSTLMGPVLCEEPTLGSSSSITTHHSLRSRPRLAWVLAARSWQHPAQLFLLQQGRGLRAWHQPLPVPGPLQQHAWLLRHLLVGLLLLLVLLQVVVLLLVLLLPLSGLGCRCQPASAAVHVLLLPCQQHHLCGPGLLCQVLEQALPDVSVLSEWCAALLQLLLLLSVLCCASCVWWVLLRLLL